MVFNMVILVSVQDTEKSPCPISSIVKCSGWMASFMDTGTRKVFRQHCYRLV